MWGRSDPPTLHHLAMYWFHVEYENGEEEALTGSLDDLLDLLRNTLKPDEDFTVKAHEVDPTE